MLFSALTEISLSIGFILIVLYGLFSLTFKSSNLNYLVDRTSSASLPNLHLSDVYFFTKVYPFMFLLGYFIDLNINLPLMDIFNPSIWINSVCFPGNSGIDLILIILTVVIMQSFKTFESTLLLLLAFIGQIFMIHSCDFVSFYICLELTNFVFLVLCGLQPRSLKTISSSTTNLNGTVNNNNIAYGSRPIAGVEASIKYLLLSAFSSGVLLFWFSVLYLHTGITNISTGALTSAFDLDLIEQSGSFTDVVPQFLILISLMFKLGAAPLHLWAIDIYSGVKRQLIMYLSTAPKLSLFGFWISSWHNVWTDYTVVIFVILSSLVGCFGAYSQPTLRSLFAYSTVNEIGLLLMAIETAGFHSLFQHLTIYIVTMLLLWSNTDKRLFAILAISLAGLPPLAGFFGKAWIFNSVAVGSLAGPYIGVLLISLFCTGLSLVYYLRVFRLFSMTGLTTTEIYPAGINSSSQPMGISTRTYSNFSIYGTSYKLTSFCVIFLIFAPLFYIKPFVL